MAAQIIQFPVQHSNGYNNLIQLFEICDSLESCNFYLESVEQLFQKGYISEKEMYTLRRIGRGKRLELTQPEMTMKTNAGLIMSGRFDSS